MLERRKKAIFYLIDSTVDVAVVCTVYLNRRAVSSSEACSGSSEGAQQIKNLQRAEWVLIL